MSQMTWFSKYQTYQIAFLPKAMFFPLVIKVLLKINKIKRSTYFAFLMALKCLESSHRFGTFLSTCATSRWRSQDSRLDVTKGNIVIPMHNITTHSVDLLIYIIIDDFQARWSGKASWSINMQAYQLLQSIFQKWFSKGYMLTK